MNRQFLLVACLVFSTVLFSMALAADTNDTNYTDNITESVKCVFNGATAEQNCNSNAGHSCSGIETCTNTVTGFVGTQLTWKSSCGGYAYTTMDGTSEYATFDCTPVETVSEQVKCVFNNSSTTQECYSENTACKGIETCTVDVKGTKGQTITWKSSCGGYAYTTMDGTSEYAKFDCGQNTCTDSDGGINYEVKGYVKSTLDGVTKEDVCSDPSNSNNPLLFEYYCDNETISGYWHQCEGNCRNGACVSSTISCTGEGQSMPVYPGYKCCDGLTAISPAKIGTDGTCGIIVGSSICSNCGNGTCESWENSCNCLADCKTTTTSCPAKITVSTNKTEYFVGDETIIKIAVFDSQGNLYGKITGNATLYVDGNKIGSGPFTTNEDGTMVGNGTINESGPFGQYIYYLTIPATSNCPEINAKTAFTVSKNSGGCICPTLWTPVCGTDGQTYANSCTAKCNSIAIAYDGACNSTAVKAELGQKFKLSEKQKAEFTQNGSYIGIAAKLIAVNHYYTTTCKENEPCIELVTDSVQLEVYQENADTSVGTEITLRSGESIRLFGLTISAIEIDQSSAVLLAEKDIVIDTLKVNLGDKFDAKEGQNVLIISNNETVMKMKLDGIIAETCAAPNQDYYSSATWTCQDGYSEKSGEATSCKSAGTWNKYAEESCANRCGTTGKCGVSSFSVGQSCAQSCSGRQYAQLTVSFANAGVETFTLATGEKAEANGFEISLLGLRIETGKGIATIVANKIETPDITVVNLNVPFSLTKNQKAIVKETKLQLKLSQIDNDTVILEVVQPIEYSVATTSSSTGSGGISITGNILASIATTSSNATIVEKTKTAIIEQPSIYNPYVKLKLGEHETETIFGHTIKLNNILAANCAGSTNCIGSALTASLTVSQEQQTDKKVYLDKKFDLKQNDTAIVIDLKPSINGEAMRIKLLEIATPSCKGSSETGIVCDSRPIVKIAVSSNRRCPTGAACILVAPTIMTIMEGQEIPYGEYGIRLLDVIENENKAWFVIKRTSTDIVKAKLNESFKLQTKQTALIEDVTVYLSLNEIQSVKCASATDSKCIGGNYAIVSAWQNIVIKESDETTKAQLSYKLRQGETLKVYGIEIALQELGTSSAKFIAKKKSGDIINVHVNEPFKLQIKQAARVLEANMRIDLLNISSNDCPICPEGAMCSAALKPCGATKAEISISSYLYEASQAGTSLDAKEFASKIIKSTTTTETSTTSISLPPMPFKTVSLGAGESITVNDFTIKATSIGYNSAEFLVTKTGTGETITITFNNGWNLFSLPGKLSTVSSDCQTNNFKIFEYNEKDKKFVPATSEKLGTAFWVYNPNDKCKVEATLGTTVSMADLDTIIPGWNFVAITKDMLGNKIRELSKACEPKSAVFYNVNSKSWENAIDRELSSSDLGKAFAINATKECRLGGIPTTDLPPLPELPVGG